MSSISTDVLFVKWFLLRDALITLLGSPHRAEMTLQALKLQAVYGKCFASARFLGGQAFHSEKCWDRCLARLRDAELVKTYRRIRPGGTLGTNVTDLRPLWRYLLEALGDLLKKGRTRLFGVLRTRTYILFKFSANWRYGEVVVHPLARALAQDRQ